MDAIEVRPSPASGKVELTFWYVKSEKYSSGVTVELNAADIIRLQQVLRGEK